MINKPKVLIINDTLELSKILTKNYEVILDKNKDTDLIIINLSNQKIESLQNFREIFLQTHIPILIIISINDQDIINNILDYGRSDYIIWPSNSEELLFRTSALLNSNKFLNKNKDIFNKNEFYQLMLLHGSLSNYSIMMIDIDNFKNINDLHGHLVGDDILKELGILLKQTIRRGDILARFGGDEFIIMLPIDINISTLVAERIKKEIEQETFENKFNQQLIKITISIGIADNISNSSVEKIIHTADQALYLAKQNGKNKVIVG
ncbi:MAG: GGDEF domain-containing protein [Rickettsiales bacterium]